MKRFTVFASYIAACTVAAGTGYRQERVVASERAEAIEQCSRIAGALGTRFDAAKAKVRIDQTLGTRGPKMWSVYSDEVQIFISQDGKEFLYQNARDAGRLAKTNFRFPLNYDPAAALRICKRAMENLGLTTFVLARDIHGEWHVRQGQGTLSLSFEERPYGFPSFLGSNSADFQLSPGNLKIVYLCVHDRDKADPPRIRLNRAQAIAKAGQLAGLKIPNPRVLMRYRLPASRCGAKAAYYHDHWRARLVYEVSDGKTMAGIDAEDGSLMEKATVVRLTLPKKHGAPTAGLKG